MRNWLKDKYVILTGASSGIGRELCKILIHKYGANVIGVGRKEEKMLSLSKELGEQADKFTYRLFDVSDKTAWKDFRVSLQEKKIAPILLINNAGAFHSFKKALDTDFQTYEWLMQTNFFSVLYAVEEISPILQGEGKDLPSIVNVSSSASLCTIAGTSGYSATKAALRAYTESLAMEEKGRKYVSLICPGTTATELFSQDKNSKNSALDIIAMPAEKMAKKIARKILKKKRRAVLGWDAKLMNWTAKLAPVKGLFLISSVMKASRSKLFAPVYGYAVEKEKKRK
jgi:short-subunit dehydrogenase